jgi:hypothetical protein
MDLDKTQAYADFRNGATFTGNALLSGQSATVSAETDLTLNGKFTLSGNQSQINVNSATSAGATTLTLGPNSEVSMTGFGAKIQSDFFTNNTNQDVVINQGLISATRVAATGTYAAEISPDVFTNQGIVRANANTGVFLLRNVTNLDSPTLTGGTWESIGNNARIVFTNNVIQVTTNAATIVLDGTGSSFATAGGALETTLVNNSAGGVLRVLGGRGYTTSNSLGNSGTIELGDGTFNSTALNNQSGGVFQGFGTITPAVSNSGLVQASGGTLVASQGVQGTAGAVQIDANGTLDLSATAGSTTGSLLHNGSAASSLNLGAHNLAVSSDYNNANFGSGDGFNRNANVSATGGTIVAAGDVAQAITGANVQNGTAASPVLAFGNVHVGDVNTKTFQVANAGTTGPALRGAIQTGVNGGNISDSQLSGSGVTASNFGPVATGAASSDFSVTYTANNAGDLAAGQQVNITNNFGNVDDQQLGFTGTAYRLAAPSTITPNPITFGNQRVGGTALQTLTLANDAINDLYSESLSASFSGTSAATASGLVSGLAPGQTNNTNLIVGLDTSVAGAITGTATLQLNSDGAGSSELGITSLGTQTVNLSGNVYRPAVANTIADVTFANRHVVPAGQTVEQTINLQNLAAADGFSESLTASLAVASGTDITAGGSINSASRVIAGASDASNLTVGIDATSSGLKSGMATLSLNSDGTGASGLSDLVLSDQTFGVQGKVYALAKPNTVAGTIALGNHHVGATVQQSLTLSNTEAAGQYTEQLSASFSGATNGGATFNGSVTGLAGGANSTALNVGLDTSLAGDRSGSMALNLTSNEVDGSGLGTTALAGQSVSVSGTVYRLAAADSIGTINLGNAHVGDTLTQNVSLSNVAVADGFSEALSASFSGASNGNANFGGSGVTALAAGATDSSGLTVALNTDQAGLRSGAMLLNQSSNEINGSGLGTTGLAGQTVAVTGSVYNYAVASTISPTTHDFGIVHVGDVLTPNQLAFANEAIAGLYSEDLRLGNWVVSGDAQVVAGSPSSVTLIAGAQSLSDIGVVVDTSTAGLKAGTFAASQASTGQVNGVAIAGFSETSLGQSTSIAFAAQVNQYAVASVLPTAGPGSLSMTSVNEYLLDFGTVSPAFGNPLTAELTVSNAVLNAAFPSDDLSGSFMTSGAGLSFVGFDGFNGLAGGDQQAGFLVNLDTSKFGLINGQILFDPTGSNASGYSGALNRITINISGAVTAVPEPAAGLMLLLSLVGSLGLRRRRQLV